MNQFDDSKRRAPNSTTWGKSNNPTPSDRADWSLVPSYQVSAQSDKNCRLLIDSNISRGAPPTASPGRKSQNQGLSPEPEEANGKTGDTNGSVRRATDMETFHNYCDHMFHFEFNEQSSVRNLLKLHSRSILKPHETKTKGMWNIWPEKKFTYCPVVS